MKLVAAWMRKLLAFLVSWGLTNIMIELPVAFRNAAETWGAYSLIIVCLKFWVHYIMYLNLCPLLGADDVSREWWQLVTAIHGQGDGLILCEYLIKLWLHSFLLCQFWFCWNGHNSCLQTVIVQFSLQTHRHTILGWAAYLTCAGICIFCCQLTKNWAHWRNHCTPIAFQSWI